MTTRAQALAVALDHAEETGEYSYELRLRIAALADRLRIIRMMPEGPAWVGTWEGRRMCSVTPTRIGTPGALPSALVPLALAPPGTYSVQAPNERRYSWVATVHTVATGTSRCWRASSSALPWATPYTSGESLAALQEVTGPLIARMRELDWVLQWR